ncbi:MAG: hypothetical protein HPY57_13895 [Ignavibacteria bacterium]|nr:hypothetical protein [Ignavibacteria bacterium]
MIITTVVHVKIQGPNIKHYRQLGYDVKVGEILTIPIEHLSKKSHQKIKIKCDVCGIEKETFYFAYTKYLEKSPDNKYRCNKCNIALREKTCLEKYGVKNSIQSEEIKEKRTRLFLEKYGVKHYNKLDIFKEKRKNTNLEKYGVESPMKDETIKSKQLKTTFDKFGVKCSLQNENVKIKTLKTMNDKYGVDYSMQNTEIKKKILTKRLETIIKKIQEKNKHILKISNNIYTIKCDLCNKTYEISSHMYCQRRIQNTVQCTICNPIGNKFSGKENLLLNFIKENYNGEIILNCRNIISPYELDIYLSNLNLAFEFNGLYWHSELYKDKNYHINKTDLCQEKGIQLIHIWEDDWNFKQDIVKSMILNKLGKTPNKIYARKCKIKEINDNKLVRKFLDENHIQGHIGSSVKIGLFYNDELVSLMTFGKKRVFMNSVSKEDEWELLRFCNKLNTNVIGAASKLFKYFTKNFTFTEITTYADRSHSNGKLYETIGLKFISKTNPNYYYVIDGIRKHRFGFRKNVLVDKGYDKNKSEHEIMLEREINRIYDSGSLKYIFQKF